MLTVPVHDFQADVLSYLHLIKQGEQITVTENGGSLATIAPPNSHIKSNNEAEKIWASEQLRQIGKNSVIGDIISPIDIEWNASR